MQLPRLLSLVLLTAVGCADDPTPAPADEVAQAATSCTPRPPINPLMCNPEEPVAPPPVNGRCLVELRATEVGFFTGQGWVEDRAEASAAFTATNLDTGAQIAGSYPVAGTVKMEVDSKQLTSIPLGSYVVHENDPNGLSVRVCATFTEKDSGFNNDDVGGDCETIVLHCPQEGRNVGLSAHLCRGGDCNNLKGRMTANIEVMTADADRDCVTNEDDYTPEPCDEAFKGQLCRASIAFFHYGNGFITDVVQNVGTDLVPALDGYDHTILLIDDTQIGPFALNAAALDAAEFVMLPTEENFFAAMRDLTARGCDIDVWMFSHGWPDWDVQADGSIISGGGVIDAASDDDMSGAPDITTDELLAETDPANSGTLEVPVRMTYGTPCHYEEWNDAWDQVGAKVTSGSDDVNFTPNFYDNFVASWSANQAYGFALATEFSQAKEDLCFAFLEAEGDLWGCSGANNSILDRNACAFDFFTDVDALAQTDANGDFIDGADEAKYCIGGPLADMAGITYDSSLSGAENMRRSSHKTLVGDPTVKKFTPATLTWQ